MGGKTKRKNWQNVTMVNVCGQEEMGTRCVVTGKTFIVFNE